MENGSQADQLCRMPKQLMQVVVYVYVVYVYFDKQNVAV